MVKIQLEDANDNPPIFDQSFYIRTINNSLGLNTVIADVSASDRDSGNNSVITYSFAPLSSSRGFELNSSTGEVFISNSTLIPGDYYLDIVATDGGTPAMSAQATVFVAIFSVIPTDIMFTETMYNFQIVESESPDTLIGTVQVVDTRSSLVPPDVIYTITNVTDCFSVSVTNWRLQHKSVMPQLMEC